MSIIFRNRTTRTRRPLVRFFSAYSSLSFAVRPSLKSSWRCRPMLRDRLSAATTRTPFRFCDEYIFSNWSSCNFCFRQKLRFKIQTKNMNKLLEAGIGLEKNISFGRGKKPNLSRALAVMLKSHSSMIYCDRLGAGPVWLLFSLCGYTLLSILLLRKLIICVLPPLARTEKSREWTAFFWDAGV